jgi:hypothetical protein
LRDTFPYQIGDGTESLKIGVEYCKSGRQQWERFHRNCVPGKLFDWFVEPLPKEVATTSAATAAPKSAKMESDKLPASDLELSAFGARCRVVIALGSRSLCRTLA